ncbi:MAG: autotransporter domain-containing protein [Verrucomicrobia bacterium]|nr:autotransporter domain-containing protein [Verrucomicrobiota bacterium]
MNKKIISAIAASLFYMSIASAADDMQMRNLENRVNALEQRRGSNGMINPAARPVVKDGVDLWVQAEALYMRPTEDGLGFAIKNKNGVTSFANGHVKNARYDWDWGFRVGAGYNLDHDGWDILANYTWFRDETRRNVHEGVVLPTEAQPANVTTATTQNAKTRLNLWLNILDVELGREFFVSKWLTLRPQMGVRALWVNRHYNTEYSRLVQGSDYEVHMKNRFSGAGLRGGLNTQWGLGSGWSLFGEVDVALMYGKQRIRQHDELETGDVNKGHVKDSWYALRSSVDLALGLRWDRLFYDDAYRIRFQLGWENHIFFDMNQNVRFVDGTSKGVFAGNRGNLSLNGVAFQARFDF